MTYRIITAAHRNSMSAYQRFDRRSLFLDPDEMLQRMGRYRLAVGMFSLFLVLGFLGWAAVRWA